LIQLYECPNCGKDSAAFVTTKDTLGGPVRCPACAPTPDKTPHDYRPLSIPADLLKQYQEAQDETDRAIREQATSMRRSILPNRWGICGDQITDRIVESK